MLGEQHGKRQFSGHFDFYRDFTKIGIIGVEIEMNNISRRDAAKLAAEFFGTGHWEDTARCHRYKSFSAWDQQGREWKFSRDSSIVGPDEMKCELITPILHYDDIETLQELVRCLRRAGAQSNHLQGCGCHYAKFFVIGK